jgi:hypothetical protein
VFRWRTPTTNACSFGSYNDHDDLVFRLGQGSFGGTGTSFDPAFMTPRCRAFGATCDSGGLLNGRASLGPEPNAYNTTYGQCTDGQSGQYHSDPSIDRVEVTSTDAGPLARHKDARVPSPSHRRLPERTPDITSWPERAGFHGGPESWQYLGQPPGGRPGAHVTYTRRVRR